ncbi:helix-turn-helix domain-containing protein [Methylobacterium sp. J-076]|uniref:helix-turn-helix domain-containing protein n=1 Tax=Methylobacterium sp. J-076 TaxID=2836655 RepID=UPI001FB8EFB6|nr:helix-turn-helix domain-containing protein [Methylobacterium sp. J-076]MCJ2014533.1 helix-turn-helix domain-containing protein [Methylobacterium sp. J-076]
MSAKSVEEAAQYLRVSQSFLNQSRIRGDGPVFYKIGRRVVYETADLDLWKETRRRRSTSEYSQEAA